MGYEISFGTLNPAWDLRSRLRYRTPWGYSISRGMSDSAWDIESRLGNQTPCGIPDSMWDIGTRVVVPERKLHRQSSPSACTRGYTWREPLASKASSRAWLDLMGWSLGHGLT